MSRPILVLIALIALPAQAAMFTSATSGNWNSVATWSQFGVPGAGDDVVITSNHQVTVTDVQRALTLSLDSTAGNKSLRIEAGGDLTLESALDGLSINAPSPGSSSFVDVRSGAALSVSGSARIDGSPSGTARLTLETGAQASIGDDLRFAGASSSAQIVLSGGNATLRIGGDLGSGGTFTADTQSIVELNGAGAQTVNAYTLGTLRIAKPSDVATLVGSITLMGNLHLASGTLDDGGNQISLNPDSTSSVVVEAVLRLGSADGTTAFPLQGIPMLAPGSAVQYQSGAVQVIDNAPIYARLRVTSLGGAVQHFVGGTLNVSESLEVADAGASEVTLVMGPSALDVGGDILGNGTITGVDVAVGGNWSAAGTLVASGTVTYDGAGAQTMLGTTYPALRIAKSSGTAQLGGDATVEDTLQVTGGTLSLATHTLTLRSNATNVGTIAAPSGTLRLAGAGAQAFTSTSDVSLGALQIANPAGVTLVGGVRWDVANLLSLEGGNLTIVPPGSARLDAAATVTRTSGWVNGALTRALASTPPQPFPVGTGSAYLPVTIDASAAGDVTVQAFDGRHPARSGENVLDRWWRIASAVPNADLVGFAYNAGDVTAGDETRYVLARHDGASYAQVGSVDPVANTAAATNASPLAGDWVIGQRGSLGFASQLAIVAINGGNPVDAGAPFDVVLQARDDDGTPVAVTQATGIALSASGPGALGGATSGSIDAGENGTAIAGASYDTAATGVVMTAARISGDDLASAMRSFDVVACTPPTVTITGPTTYCSGSAAITLDAGAGFTSYAWSTGATTRTITVSPATTTTFNVTVFAGTCSASDAHTVGVFDPNAGITAPPAAGPGASGLTASAAPQSGATYAWSITNGTITSAANTPSITFTVGTSGTTVLSVTVTIGPCSASSMRGVTIADAVFVDGFE